MKWRWKLITTNEYLKLKDQYPDEYTDKIGENAKELLDRVNRLLAMHQGQSVLRSGWRPPSYNSSVPNAATHSRHMTGQAVDVADVDGSLGKWCVKNEKYLEDFKLWCEDIGHTKTWVHFQSVSPASGKRFFIP